MVLGVCGKWVRSSVSQTTPIRPRSNRFKQDLAVGPSQAVERHAPLLCAMEEILYGSTWCMSSPLLTTDDAVMLRTVSCRWNEGNRRGVGEVFFMMVQSDPYEKKSHCDSDLFRVCFRRRGLHLPQEERPSYGQDEVDVASFGDAVMALTGIRLPKHNWMSRRYRDTWSRSTTSWYRKGWAPPASGEDTMAESYTGWSRRDTRGASSSGQGDKSQTRRGTK